MTELIDKQKYDRLWSHHQRMVLMIMYEFCGNANVALVALNVMLDTMDRQKFEEK